MASILAPAPQTRTLPLRRAVVAVVAVAVVVLGHAQLDRLFRGGLNAPLDFAAFWAAGHLATNGENPYRGDRLRDMQASVGLTEITVIAWNPPWALALLMPFGAVPFRTAYGGWVVLRLALVIASAGLLWRAFGGKRVWAPVALALGFAPTVFLVGNGQLTAVVLFGLAGFGSACRAGRPALAGAALALVATKPHLLVPLGVWVLFTGCRTAFGRRALLGALATLALLCVPPALAVPSVWGDYANALAGPPDPHIRPPSAWNPPLVGWWLRQTVPGAPFWVQWAPALLGAAGAAGWCLRCRVGLQPDSFARLPVLVGVSLLVAPYGAWAYDLVLLLVPVLAVAARLANAAVWGAVAAGAAVLSCANGVALAMMLNYAPAQWYVWFAPCVLLGAVEVARHAPPMPALAPA